MERDVSKILQRTPMKKERKNDRKASSEALMVPSADGDLDSRGRRQVGRRSFLKGLGMAGATLLPASALLMGKAEGQLAGGDVSGSLTAGDAAILRFLAVAEILESDLWEQYWELGGHQAKDFASATQLVPTGGNKFYTDALTILDGDMPQYIQDNTDDEFSHAKFLEAYLKSKGASVAELNLLNGPTFRTLQGSTAIGVNKQKIGKRLTNLLQLSVDTSYWTRYRSDMHNPDLPDGFVFPQAVQGLNVGQHPAIPRDDNDTKGSVIGNPTNHLKAIAFAAGFHFGFIEQGGTSLYPSLAQRVTDPEVLRILLSIGPTETMHFQTWHDKAGNATPLSVDGLTFINLGGSTHDELLQANLIMPEPTHFLDESFPICSIIRPTATNGAAMGAVDALSADGLFNGQTEEFFELLADLASDADAATRGF